MCCACNDPADEDVIEMSSSTSPADVPPNDLPVPIPEAAAPGVHAAPKLVDPHVQLLFQSAPTPPPVVKEPGVFVTFWKADGKTIHEVLFTRRPLGLDFFQHVPIEVKRVKPNTLAEELGVQPKWKVKAIDGIDCKCNSFAEDFEVFGAAVARLPE
eukprot:NODE_19887_length_823_cov_3.375000.p2 GENE.NODE_19887_length_823_cov_3.375000~~NODE_19887_length_823_cov_3.375000.p2  ORF type:complete len:177 (-),score=55.15 NODE_19887_length_823_cov_3.375000:293-760(-)